MLQPYLARAAADPDGVIERWLAANPGIKKVVILLDTKDAVSKSDGSAVLPAALKERGITVLDSISFQTGDIDYSAQVTKAKSLNPDGLVVAAHTHGGQVSVPGYGALIVPGAAPREWAYGWITHKGRRMYVTSGLGVSILPVRFNMRPEWVMFR